MYIDVSAKELVNDTNGTEESVIFSEVFLFQGFGMGKVRDISSVQGCPYKGVSLYCVCAQVPILELESGNGPFLRLHTRHGDGGGPISRLRPLEECSGCG